MKFRFHVVGLPHTATSKRYTHCAYTQKVLNFCKMMVMLGHEVYHYGGEDSDVPCTEHITVVTRAQKEEWYAHDGTDTFFPDIVFDASLVPWREMNARTIMEMEKRIKPKEDFICLIAGLSQKAVADAFPDNINCEYGIGYSGTCSKFRCFESYAWMHYLAGEQRQSDVHWYDTVIPNYFDPDDFPMGEHKGNHHVFLGRLIQRKGLGIAGEICRLAGERLRVAGQGLTLYEPGKRLHSREVKMEGSHFEYVGVVDKDSRKKFLGDAKSLIIPTTYCGPFEGVHVEAMLCGTPVITSSWGCYTETVRDGIDGFRINTLMEGAWAAKEVAKLDHAEIRRNALSKWTLEAVAPRYQRWFEQLHGLYTGNWWDQPFKGR